MNKIDFEKIAATHTLSAVIGRRVKLTSAGKGEFKGLCPFHNERSPSFTVSDAKGFFHCYGCGAHGDVVDFVADSEGVPISQAVRMLTGDTYTPTKRDPSEPPPSFDPYAGIVAAEIPDSHEPFMPGRWLEVWNVRKERTWRMRPSMVFPYRTTDGELLGYVVRVEFDDGKKVTPTLRFVRLPDGTETWAAVPFDRPRPLYALDRLTDGQVVVVEGEKAAEAAARLLPQVLPVVTWPGGTQGVKHADWRILAGRPVVIWPDADAPGVAAAAEIRTILEAQGCPVKVARPDDDMAPGYDAADAERDGWDRARTLAWLRAATTPIAARPEPEEPPPHDEAPPEQHDEQPDAPPPKKRGRPRKEPPPPHDDVSLAGDEMPFRILGFDDGQYFYMPRSTQQMTALTASSHTFKNLIQLAPLEYWERTFGGLAKANEMAAANALMGQAHRQGTFYPERLRGRGAWAGEQTPTPTFHVGQFAVVGDERRDLYEVDGAHIYPARRPMPGIDMDQNAATSEECKRLVQLLERLNWDNPLSAVALAGWIVIAPVCGALDWRPHVWLTGGPGSGKTTVLLDIIWRLIRAFGQKFEGNTTEAGIRQTLGPDALPVLLDEAEAETERAQNRMTAILDLVRLASSGSTVSKGTQNGEAIKFTIRSAFCLSSIEHSIKQHADETRITKLVLKKRGDEKANEDFKALRRDIRDWLTPEFANGLFVRTWTHIDTLLANVATCVDAAADVLRDRRAADQIGTLIAGYIMLHTTRAVTFDEASEFVRRYDWSDHTAISARRDHDRLLERILTHEMNVTSGHSNKRVTIADLINARRGLTAFVDMDDARRILGPLGIRVESSGVWIASSASRLGRDVLAGTQWASDWSRPLRDLPGATVLAVKGYAPGVTARGTCIPLALFDPPKPEDEPAPTQEDLL